MVVPELPQAQDAAGPAAGKVPVGVFTGLVFREAVAQSEPQVGAVVSDAMQPGACSTEWRGCKASFVNPVVGMLGCTDGQNARPTFVHHTICAERQDARESCGAVTPR